jgi:hypothetical protein
MLLALVVVYCICCKHQLHLALVNYVFLRRFSCMLRKRNAHCVYLRAMIRLNHYLCDTSRQKTTHNKILNVGITMTSHET